LTLKNQKIHHEGTKSRSKAKNFESKAVSILLFFVSFVPSW